MSASRKRLTIGDVECGYDMSNGPSWHTHIFAYLFAITILIFTYAVLLEGNGLWYAVGGFIMGFTLLFYLYGQNFDRVYIHFGKFKFGGDAYDPERKGYEAEYIEIEDEDEF